MRESPEAAWEFELADAAAIDRANGRRPETGLAALVVAARDGALAAHYPYAGHNRLCVSRGPRWWIEAERPLPGFVTLAPGEGYVVWRGAPQAAPVEAVLTTRSAVLAVAGLVRALGLDGAA
ncbi:hypothetical protein [Kitasatospora sp. NPDC085879]|uniref:hypothetical protein n=1 Tax=Kitasatospora sp. NPDC085879 TaxID=3154769 RepID=UPI0034365A7B